MRAGLLKGEEGGVQSLGQKVEKGWQLRRNVGRKVVGRSLAGQSRIRRGRVSRGRGLSGGVRMRPRPRQ